MAFDLAMVETKDGGDILLSGNDLVKVYGIENQPYLCMFSGQDWWGNKLLLNENPLQRYHSVTEQVFQQVALNSSGRVRIEQAITQDLQTIAAANPGITIEVVALLVAPDRLDININLNGEPARINWNPPPAVENYVRQLSGINYWIIEFNFIVS